MKKEKRAKVQHDLRVGEVEFNRIQEGGQKCIIIQSIGQFQVGDDLFLVEVKDDGDRCCNFVTTGRTFKTFITDITEGNNIAGLREGYAVLSLYGGGFLEMAKEGKKLSEIAGVNVVAETEEGRLP